MRGTLDFEAFMENFECPICGHIGMSANDYPEYKCPDCGYSGVIDEEVLSEIVGLFDDDSDESDADFSSLEEDLDWDSDNNQGTFDDFDDELIEDLLSDDTIDISSDSSINFDDIGDLDDFEDFDFK